MNNKEEPKENDFSSDDESIQSTRTGNVRVTNKKSREELNEIEKQRTRRINEQILSIRGLLDVSNFGTRKDKYSVLCSAYDFIVRLKKTIEEYRLKLGEKRFPNMNSEYSYFDPEGIINQNVTAGGYQSNGLPRNGYDHLLKYCRSPMALMTIDAKFVSCNESFCSFTGFSSEELLKMSLFNLSSTYNLKLLFKSVGTLIDQAGNNAHHIWNQFQFKYKECLCFTSLWIVENNDGNPAFIQMMLVRVEDCVNTVGQKPSKSNSQATPTLNPLQLPQQTNGGGNSRGDFSLGTDPTEDDLWTQKQSYVAMLRQKFAEQQAINPNNSLLPLLKIKQEYEKIQQQQQQLQEVGKAMGLLPPRTSSLSSTTSSPSSWLHPSQSWEEAIHMTTPSAYQLQSKYSIQGNQMHSRQKQQQSQQQQLQQQQDQDQNHYYQSQYNSQQDSEDDNQDDDMNSTLMSDHHHQQQSQRRHHHPLFSAPLSTSSFLPTQDYDMHINHQRTIDKHNGKGGVVNAGGKGPDHGSPL